MAQGVIRQGLFRDFSFFFIAEAGQLGTTILQVLEDCQALRIKVLPGSRLIDQVDGLVGLEAVHDVAVGQLDRGLQDRKREEHVMVFLVVILYAEQNLECQLLGRLVDHDFLKAALKGRILLDEASVLIKGG